MNNRETSEPKSEHSDQDSSPQTLSEAEIAEQMAYIDGVNGSAGHYLEDEYLRDLLSKSIAGEITSEQYRLLGMEHLRKQVKP